ncbi:hypothetical protein [Ottowia thiooxydans]|uniref:hypothetical protein n=1 Tax=Ottowia thiooxydans TaxID=219182 RepID=UPI000686980E|nr:hypothetical protein [Ottowia thiooxydans]
MEADSVAVDDLLLREEEIRAVTGGYVRPAEQLSELHLQGFFRARRSRAGNILLERAHYEAVCSGGATKYAENSERRPKMHSHYG